LKDLSAASRSIRYREAGSDDRRWERLCDHRPSRHSSRDLSDGRAQSRTISPRFASPHRSLLDAPRQIPNKFMTSAAQRFSVNNTYSVWSRGPIFHARSQRRSRWSMVRWSAVRMVVVDGRTGARGSGARATTAARDCCFEELSAAPSSPDCLQPWLSPFLFWWYTTILVVHYYYVSRLPYRFIELEAARTTAD
jgi:hypothetical protein